MTKAFPSLKPNVETLLTSENVIRWNTRAIKIRGAVFRKNLQLGEEKKGDEDEVVGGWEGWKAADAAAAAAAAAGGGEGGGWASDVEMEGKEWRLLFPHIRWNSPSRGNDDDDDDVDVATTICWKSGRKKKRGALTWFRFGNPLNDKLGSCNWVQLWVGTS